MQLYAIDKNMQKTPCIQLGMNQIIVDINDN